MKARQLPICLGIPLLTLWEGGITFFWWWLSEGKPVVWYDYVFGIGFVVGGVWLIRLMSPSPPPQSWLKAYFTVTSAHLQARAAAAPCPLCWSAVTICALVTLVGAKLMADRSGATPGPEILFILGVTATALLGWLAFYRRCGRLFHLKLFGALAVIGLGISGYCLWSGNV